jgi:hypothetical protein
MADYTPPFQPGAAVTRTASTTITGGQVIEVTGNGTVGTAGADSTKVIGVAAHDAASGARVTVHGLVGQVHEVVATAGVTAGDGLATGAAGTVKTVVIATAAAAGTLIGVAETTAGAGLKTRFTGRY